MTIGEAREVCAPDDALLAFVEGRLSGDSLASLEHHIGRCPDCCHVVAELARQSVDESPVDLSDSATATIPEKATLDRGHLVGRYQISRVIGAGGMGVVYRAHDPELNRSVALKLLHSSDERSGSGDTHARLVREAQSMARLSHPNVVTVYDAGRLDGRVFIAMELVEGHTLGQWLVDAQRVPREILDVFVQAGRGVAAAHAAGLIHRDFKPDNVLVAADGRVRVTDFGLALPTRAAPEADPVGADDPTRVDPVGSVTLTRTGARVGTPLYMAPEQFAGAATDVRTDQFSFCVALYQGLYGERPFVGTTLAQLADEVTQGRIRPRPPSGSMVSTRLHEALLRGLRPSPDERYPSMSDLLAVLEDELAAMTRAPSLADVPPPAAAPFVAARAPSPRRRRLILVAAAVALVLVAGLGAWRLTSDAPTRAAAPAPTPATAAPPRQTSVPPPAETSSARASARAGSEPRPPRKPARSHPRRRSAPEAPAATAPRPSAPPSPEELRTPDFVKKRP